MMKKKLANFSTTKLAPKHPPKQEKDFYYIDLLFVESSVEDYESWVIKRPKLSQNKYANVSASVHQCKHQKRSLEKKAT